MARVWWQLGQSVHIKTCMWGRPLLLWATGLFYLHLLGDMTTPLQQPASPGDGLQIRWKRGGGSKPVESHSGAGENIIAGPITPPPPFCMSWDRHVEGVERGGRGERCPLTIRLGVRGSVVSSPRWAPAENGFYAYFRSERSHLEAGTPFAVFLSDGGAPHTSRGPGKLSPCPPPLSTDLGGRRCIAAPLCCVHLSTYELM